jgi:hypothetical protein
MIKGKMITASLVALGCSCTLATGGLDDSIVFAGATAECHGFVRHQPRRGLAFRMDWPPISGRMKQPGRSRPTPPATVTMAPCCYR